MNQFKIKAWLKENKKSWYIWLMLISLSLFFTFLQQKDNKKGKIQIRNLDTYIPKDFVLVPVELSNGPSLDGLLEYKGIVDLYIGDPVKQRAEKVAESVKIIRSPRNPSYFAVLVPEENASFLIQRFQAFHAVIQNPEQQKKTKIYPVTKKRKRTIIIELDNSSHF
ncbi:MAG: hypothetical protein OXM55_00180 [Bdellovibrionales bacterium]|nr:hypothetical protein [Bdellovibrionales bacterium]